MIDPATSPGLPRGEADEPVFRAPWEAHAFALVVQLHQRGLFTWPEWADELARQIRHAQAAGDSDLGDTYYRHWLASLERWSPATAQVRPPSFHVMRRLGTTLRIARRMVILSNCDQRISVTAESQWRAS